MHSPFDSDEFLLKVDHQINDAHRLTGSYFITGGTNTVAAGTGNLPWASQQFNWRQHNVNVSDTWIVNAQPDQPGVVQLHAQLRRPPESARRRRWPISDRRSRSRARRRCRRSPSAATSRCRTRSAGRPPAAISTPAATSSAGRTGRHAVKLGGELSLNKTIQDTLLNNYGVFTFNNSVTRNALADFRSAFRARSSQDAPVTAYWNSWYGAAFVQDDFRLNGARDAQPRLALGCADAGHRSAQPVHDLCARPEIHRQSRRRRSGSCSTATPASSAA